MATKEFHGFWKNGFWRKSLAATPGLYKAKGTITTSIRFITTTSDDWVWNMTN